MRKIPGSLTSLPGDFYFAKSRKIRYTESKELSLGDSVTLLQRG
jgi:hypothetical protein